MHVREKIEEYLKKKDDKKNDSSIFISLADEIIKGFPYRLKNKTYLLIPNIKDELREMAYEYVLTNGDMMPISLTLELKKIMDKFNEVVEKLGFTIINDISQYKNDGELIDLLGRTSDANQVINEENTIPFGANAPLTLSVDEYLKNIFFPVVFKNITANRGEDKYLIENEEQLRKIIDVLNLPESIKLNLKNEFVVQQYIKSFDGINSSIRVIVSSSGDILASIFLISTNQKPKRRNKKLAINVDNPCEYLTDPSSKYFLNSKNIVSNVAAGGKMIPLNNKINNLNPNDELMLLLHGIDPDTLELPKTIIEQCEKIATFWGTRKGIVMGIDFIYNSNDDNWYYLETNRNPSVIGYNHFMNLKGYGKKDVKCLMQLDSLLKIVEKSINKDIKIQNLNPKQK